MPNLMIVQNEYNDSGALRRVLDYALNTPLKGGYAVDPEYAYQMMHLIKRAYGKTDGVQLKHFIVSFTQKEVYSLGFEDMKRLGFEIGKIMKNYQMVYGIHLDAGNEHIHFVMNTVSFQDGKKYADGIHGFYKVLKFLQEQFPGSVCRVFPSQSHYQK